MKSMTFFDRQMVINRIPVATFLAIVDERAVSSENKMRVERKQKMMWSRNIN